MDGLLHPTGKSYISSASTTELYNFLKFCMDNNRWGSYSYVVDKVFKELELRYVPESVTAELAASWKQFLRENPTTPRSLDEFFRTLKKPEKSYSEYMKEHRERIKAAIPDWYDNDPSDKA